MFEKASEEIPCDLKADFKPEGAPLGKKAFDFIRLGLVYLKVKKLRRYFCQVKSYLFLFSRFLTDNIIIQSLFHSFFI